MQLRFQSTPSVWRETTTSCCLTFSKLYFNPLPPCGGRRSPLAHFCAVPYDFNPLPPCGGRPSSSLSKPPVRYFNPLPPCGGRRTDCRLTSAWNHFNPLPPCGGRRRDIYLTAPRNSISIHSLRVEGDGFLYPVCEESSNFNPLPPCGGRRRKNDSECAAPAISIHSLRVEGDSFRFLQNLSFRFQSTPSVWRETASEISILFLYHFNPLPPCGGRPGLAAGLTAATEISIHSLRVEGDAQIVSSEGENSISIHSLRVEGDRILLQGHKIQSNFNPLPPCGGRRFYTRPNYHKQSISIHSLRVEGDMLVSAMMHVRHRFQSTPSVWRETIPLDFKTVIYSISIHSLRVEGDTMHLQPVKSRSSFQSTPSVWRETPFCQAGPYTLRISIHSLRVEGDILCITSGATRLNFNPLPPCGGRRNQKWMTGWSILFQSTPSVWRETKTAFGCGNSRRISIHSLRVEGDLGR